jgi:hypothetical protein
MEENQCDSHYCRGCADMGLPHCLQCLQERTNRGPLPPLQTGLGLIFFNNFFLSKLLAIRTVKLPNISVCIGLCSFLCFDESVFVTSVYIPLLFSI